MSTLLSNPIAPAAGRQALAAASTSSRLLASAILAGGVAALVVTVDQLIDGWAETHVLAAWLALWAVAVLAIALLRGVTRRLAQAVVQGLDGWSAGVAQRRADERLWAIASQDARLMADLQGALSRAEREGTAGATLAQRRAARAVRSQLNYI
jgi:hypothetical protein